MKFEHIHVKNNDNNHERGNSYANDLVLECDQKVKEERVKLENYQKK